MAHMLGKITDTIVGAANNLGTKLENVFDDPLDKARQRSAIQESYVTRKPRANAAQALDDRATAVIDSLDHGYLDEVFDPVGHELTKLGNDTSQDDIDALTDKLTTRLEVVSGQLSRHVMKNQEQLVAGVNTVATVQDDVKAAFFITQSTRSFVKTLSEEILKNIRVSEQTRRKQRYMELLEICMKIQRAKDLQKSLKKAQEGGEFGEAILMCMQSFESVGSLRDLSVTVELRAAVQRSYVDTLSKLDHMLTSLCTEFGPEGYGKVLEGYLLQSLAPPQLAEKVQQCFKESISDVTSRVVRSLLLTKRNVDQLRSALDGTYSDLCRALSVDLLRPCLMQLMERLFDVLSSYHVMARWHEAAIANRASLSPTAASLSPSAANQAGGAKLDADTMRDAMMAFIHAVEAMLRESRLEILEASARRIQDLLEMPGLFKGEDLLQVVEWCQKFVGMGEAFVGGDTPLRAKIASITTSFFQSYHRANMESLHMLLTNEHWHSINFPAGHGHSAHTEGLHDAVWSSPLYMPAYHEPGARTNFEDWILAGNPFRKAGVQENKKRRNMAELLQKTNDSPSGSKPGSLSDFSTITAQLEDSAAAPRADASSAGHATSTSSTPEASRLGEASPRSAAASTSFMVTISSQQALKWLRQYANLMRPLDAGAMVAFVGICELFEGYMVSAFLLFGGLSLGDLVWREGAVTPRLRTALLRILTGEGSKHKAQVEELMSTRPLPTDRGTSASLLDEVGSRFSEIGGDVAGGFKSFVAAKNIMGKLIDITASATSDGGGEGSPTVRPVDRVDALSAHSIVTSGNLFGLRERVVAAESLTHLADELRAARVGLVSALPAFSRREAETWFTRTVEASTDLRDVMLQGGTKLLLQSVLDPEHGLAAQIALTNYAPKEPLVSVHAWAETMLRAWSTFHDSLAGVELPAAVVNQMWEHGVAVGAQAMLEGLSRIKRCTIEGRAGMSMDLMHVERGLRPLLPPGFRLDLRTVDNYIKAYFLPWEELSKWSQVHLVEYGRTKIANLVECIADAYKVKKHQKVELLQQIAADSAEFA